MKKINYNAEDLNDHYGVSAVIKNKNGEILMQRHVKYGFWTIPVGKVAFNEDILEGLKKEVFEECNLIIKKSKELFNKKYVYIRNGKRVSVDTHLYEIISYDGKMENKEPEKHETQIFLSLEKIKKLPFLSDTTLLYLKLLGIKRPKKI